MKKEDIIKAIEKKVAVLETVKRGLETSGNPGWDKKEIETLERNIQKFQRKLSKAETTVQS